MRSAELRTSRRWMIRFRRLDDGLETSRTFARRRDAVAFAREHERARAAARRAARVVQVRAQRAEAERSARVAAWRPPSLPAGPLLALVAARGGDAAVAAPGIAERRALKRARASGRVTVTMADTLAVRLLGVTPWEVWGAAYDVA